MNDILSITVDATVKHGTHAKKCAATRTIKTRRNDFLKEHYIINLYPIFETIRKMHGVCKFDLTLERATPKR